MDQEPGQTGNFSRKMETIKENQIKSKPVNKNIVTEIKDAFDKVISKLNTVRKPSVNLKISKTKALTMKHRE